MSCNSSGSPNNNSAIRLTLLNCSIILAGTSGAWTNKSQRFETITAGNILFSHLRYTSASMVKNGEENGTISYRPRMSLSNGRIEVYAENTRCGTPLFAGQIKGQMVGTITVRKDNPDAVVRYVADANDIQLNVTSLTDMAYTSAGQQSKISARSATLANIGPIDSSATPHTGPLKLIFSSVVLRQASIVFGASSSPTDVDLCASGPTHTVLDAGKIGILEGSFNVCNPRGVSFHDFASSSDRFTSTAKAFEVSALKINLAPTGSSITASGILLQDLNITVPDTKLAVKGIGAARVQEVSAPLSTSASGIHIPTPFKTEPSLQPNKESMIEAVNDGFSAVDTLLPTGDASIPFISAHALRSTYASLSEALVDSGGHHAILLVVDPSGAVTRVEHSVTPMPGQQMGGYLCIGVAFAAKVSITGLEIAKAVRNILPFALAGSLQAGVMLSPAVTPYVFAGITAVGVIGQLAGSEYFWGTVSEETGIPGLPKLEPKDVLGDLVQTGVNKVCDLTIQGLTNFPEPWPDISSQQHILVLPSRNNSEPFSVTIDKRRSFLLKNVPKGPKLPQSSADNIKKELSCCNISAFQAAHRQNETIWSQYSAEAQSKLAALHATQLNAIQKDWATSQSNNIKISGHIQQTYEQLAAAARASLSQAIGGQNGTVVVTGGSGGISSGNQGGSQGGGNAGSCSACDCSLTCLKTTIGGPN